PDPVFDLFGSPPAFTSNPVFNSETCIQPTPHTKPKPRVRPIRQDSGHAFEHRIASLLNRNGIKAHVFPSEQGDNGIDIIATYNRQIILIQCKNTVKLLGVKILRDFQASVHRFGDAILSVVVYNSKKLKYNPL
ncbi:16816_t:CDS:1, partial [Dentiscutata heterogama]